MDEVALTSLPQTDLTPARRQELIADSVLQQGSVLVDVLADRFGVSRMTIHRDLDDLETKGILRKVRGGATAERSNLFESNVRFRERTALREKEAIARAAIKYVETGQSLIFDESTTLISLVRLLDTALPLTIITNFLPIIKQLSTMGGIRLISLGGEYIPKYDSFSGLVCRQAVASLHSNVVFMSTSAISGGIAYHPEPQIVEVKRAMMAAAERRILLVDHSKFGKTALHQFCSLSDFDRIIVDEGISPEIARELEKAHVTVEIAPFADG